MSWRSNLDEDAVVLDLGTIGLEIDASRHAQGFSGAIVELPSYTAAMIRAVASGPDFPPQSITLPFELYTPENL